MLRLLLALALAFAPIQADAFFRGPRSALLRRASPLVAMFDANVGALPAWLTFSRATTGTFIGSNGLIQTAAINTPRFDFTGGSPGLLIEESRTNLALQSQNFADASWQVFAGVAKVAAGASDPSGGTSAHEISFGATGGAISAASALYRTHTFAAGAHTFSVWLRSKTGATTVRLAISDGAAVVTGTADLPLTTSLARSSLTVTTASGFGNISIRNNVAGNSANIFNAFAQLEAGSFPTSYIPAAGSAVTRAADIGTLTAFAANPAKIDATNLATGVRSWTNYPSGIGATLPTNRRIHRIEIYRLGTTL